MADEKNPVLEAISQVETKLNEKVQAQREEIKEMGASSEKTATEIKGLTDQLGQLSQDLAAARAETADMEAKLNAVKSVREEEYKSLGERFVASDAYTQYKADPRGNGRSFEAGGSLGAEEFKTTFTGASLGDTPAYMYNVARVAEYIRNPDRMRFVRELIPTFGVSEGAVEFVRQSSFTNNAGMVPEFAATDSTSKPESAVAFEVVSVPIRTMAHGIPVTRQIVDDERQIRSYIENRLLYGLRLKEDQQILSGAGTGNDIQGILTASGVQTMTQLTSGTPADNTEIVGTKIDAIRRSITLSTIAEFSATGIVLNHNDWEDIELEKGNDEHYIWVNVVDSNGSRLWGLPVVPTNAIAEGTFLTGDFARGSAIHDRENANIRITDSHSDWFMKNLWALLAEERLAQTIYRPEAFVVGTFAS